MTEQQTYDVVLLVEQALSRGDAEQLQGLHDAIEEPVVYHVLLPIEDSATSIESGLGGLAAGEMMVLPSVALDADIDQIRQELLDEARSDLDESLAALAASGADARGEVVSIDPIDALAAKVGSVDAREAIVLTRPHVVKEFFHVDWTSRARRKLGVPVLHLLEHETLEQQAGPGDTTTGI